jgi:DNA polymerase-3 subunit beta
MSAAYLRWMLEKLSFAMSSDEKRYYLNGIYLHPEQTADRGAVLNAVATDGHRLSRVQIPSPPELADLPGTIISRRAVPDILSMLVGASGNVRIGVAPRAVRFEAQGLRYETEPINGVYPNYGAVFPARTAATIAVPPRELIQAVARVAGDSAIGGQARAVQLKLGDGFAELSLPSDGAAMSDRLSVTAQTGDRGLSIGLSPRYLVEILRRVDGERVEIALDTPQSPVVFRNPGVPALVFVLMPMRI